MSLPRKQLRTYIQDKFRSEGPRSMPLAQRTALRIFLDASLEIESLADFHSVCVLVPEICLGAGTSLYLLDRDGHWQLRRTTYAAHIKKFALPGELDTLAPCCAVTDHACIFAIFDPSVPESRAIGLFCVHKVLSAQENDFYIQYADKIARIMLMKQTAVCNKKRLAFINNLVRDIGHNIIVPNMHFKLLFLRMEKTLDTLSNKASRLSIAEQGRNDLVVRRILPTLIADLRDQLGAITFRFQQSSLFLESLLRRSHFEKGHYDLILRPCKFKSQIIEPQLNRFRLFLVEQGITVQIAPEVHIDHDIVLEADLGLMSQVFANLFSNAVKYTQAVARRDGEWRKELVYGWEDVHAAFGSQAFEIRLYISTTGPPVSESDARRLFDANFRSSAVNAAEGSGHGLYFVKQIVELHGGRVEYGHAQHMNTFSVILPCSQHSVPSESAPCPNPF